MGWAERELRKSQDPEDNALADKIAQRLQNKGSDLPITPENLPRLTGQTTWDTYAQEMIDIAVGENGKRFASRIDADKKLRAEYKDSPHTPELLTYIWTEVHKRISEGLKIEYTVDPFPASLEAIRTVEQAGRLPIYVPKEIYQQGDGYIYTTHLPIFDQQRTKWLKGFADKFKPYGWLHTEASPDAPNTNTTEGDLRSLFAAKGLLPMGVNAYEVTSEFLTILDNVTLDQTFTHSRLLSSRVNGNVMNVGHRNDWSLEYFTVDPNYQAPNLGGRSIGTFSEDSLTRLAKQRASSHRRSGKRVA